MGLSVNELVAAVESGAIKHGMTFIASQWVKLHKEELVPRRRKVFSARMRGDME